MLYVSLFALFAFSSEYYRMLMSAYATGINLVLGRVGYRLLDVGMILAYALTTDDPIKASTIFVIVSFCQILSGSFMRFFPRAVQLAAEGHVTVNRIEVQNLNFNLIDHCFEVCFAIAFKYCVSYTVYMR